MLSQNIVGKKGSGTVCHTAEHCRLGTQPGYKWPENTSIPSLNDECRSTVCLTLCGQVEIPAVNTPKSLDRKFMIYVKDTAKKQIQVSDDDPATEKHKAGRGNGEGEHAS